MANLSSTFLGIKSTNPFWLASAPPTDKKYNIEWGNYYALIIANENYLNFFLYTKYHP